MKDSWGVGRVAGRKQHLFTPLEMAGTFVWKSRCGKYEARVIAAPHKEKCSRCEFDAKLHGEELL